MPLGGLDEQGNMKITKPMQSAARKLIRETEPSPDGPFRWLNKPLEIARNGWLNRYGTPEDFIIRDRQRNVDAYEIIQELIGFLHDLEKSAVNLEEAKALQEVLEGKALNDSRLNRMAAPIRKSIDEHGKKLVELGLLPEKAYLRNFGKYLHRSYLKYEVDAPG